MPSGKHSVLLNGGLIIFEVGSLLDHAECCGVTDRSAALKHVVMEKGTIVHDSVREPEDGRLSECVSLECGVGRPLIRMAQADFNGPAEVGIEFVFPEECE